MDYFRYLRGELQAEDVSIQELAEKHGTPLYVYSSRTILEHFRKLRDAFAGAGGLSQEPVICYSVKANSNLSILKLMKDEGSGFDVVSGGELYRALKVGADPKKCVFAGVGKNDEEITYALEQGILLFNVESEEELTNIDRIAGKLGKKAPVALRVNPDVDPQTHTYISTGKKETKFGVDLIRAKRIVQS
ncbi:MAG TPA: diaminopimelate decarboxylase, partial [Planctomycetota bacterium]|nr:diaminopimelate decarboxylase [Planctomycetota bacterium]